MSMGRTLSNPAAVTAKTQPGPARHGIDIPRWLSIIAMLLAAVFLLLPILVIVPLSFGDQRYLSFPDGAWSLRHYLTLLDGAWLYSARCCRFCSPPASGWSRAIGWR
jgi:putative spermidine/putrescine transport system permease protein